MSNIYTHCDHGKSYKVNCAACDKVWFEKVTLPELIRRSKRAAHYCLRNPGNEYAASAALLHEAIAQLAAIVQKGKR